MKRMGPVLLLTALPLAALASAPTVSAKRSFESVPPLTAQGATDAGPDLAGKVSAASRPEDNDPGKPNGNATGGGNAGGNGKANGCDKGRGKAKGCNDSPG